MNTKQQSQPSSSKSSIWDTLNAIKARREANETSVKQHGQHETVRKQAHQQFETLLNHIVEARINGHNESHNNKHNSNHEVHSLLSDFHQFCKDDTQVSKLVMHYQTATPVQTQLTDVRRQLQTAFNAVDDASMLLKQSRRSFALVSNSVKQ